MTVSATTPALSISTFMTVGSSVAENVPLADRALVLSHNPKYHLNQPLPQTKCVVTVGPACWEPEQLRGLIAGGATGFRFNMSHVTTEEQLIETMGRVLHLRHEAKLVGRQVAAIADMKGPEFRVSATEDLTLKIGDRVLFTSRPGNSFKDENKVVLHFRPPQDYNLVRDLRENEDRWTSEQRPNVKIDDGQIDVELDSWSGVFDAENPDTDFWGTVHFGGVVAPNKAINFPGLTLPNLPGMTLEDEDVIAKIFSDRFVRGAWDAYAEGKPEIADFLSEAVDRSQFALLGFDYVAPSFVRSLRDIQAFEFKLKRLQATHISLIPKIETREAVDPDTLREIISHPIVVGAMVARGDLAVETSFWEVPDLERLIHGMSRARGKFSILATEVLGSMTGGSPNGTRGEYGNIYLSLRQGVHSVMLSGETAQGKDPQYIVDHLLDVMASSKMEPAIARRGLRMVQRQKVLNRREQRFDQMIAEGVDAAILKQEDLYNDTVRNILHIQEKGIADGVVLWSHYGRSMRAAAQALPHVPIYVVTDNPRVAREGTLTRGIFPILVDRPPQNDAELKELVASKVVAAPEKDSVQLKVMHNLGI